MKKRDMIELIIEKLHYGGKSEGRCQGQKVILKGGIKGQKVKAMVKKVQKDKILANIAEVLEKSPDETQKTCKNFGICGGCTYLGVPYNTQLAYKKQMLHDLFEEGGHREILDFEILPSPQDLEYKNKMEFTFGDEEKGGALNLGLHKKGSALSIVDVSDCMLVSQDYRKIIEFTRDYFREKNIPHYHILSHEGVLRHLVVRRGVNTKTILVNIVTTSQMDVELNDYINGLLKLKTSDKIIGILHTINDRLADAVIADKTEILYGNDILKDVVLSKEYMISPFSFFQTNTKGAEVLYQVAIDMVKKVVYTSKREANVLFDLYSGTGTIGIALSDVAKKIYSIEIVEQAVEMAKINAEKNGISNIEFICGDVGQKVADLVNNGIKPDIIVLDPPRGGIIPKALNDIIEFKAKNIVYISCNPASFVKDLSVLKQAGYSVKKTKAVDMFPYTTHVETIALIQRVKP